LFSIPYLRTILLFTSVAYLTYLAGKIAFSGSRIALIAPRTAPGFWNGFTLQFINPKAYAVNTALFTGFAFLPTSYTLEVAVKVAVLNAFWIPIHFLWLWVGVYLKRLSLPDGIQRLINITMAVTMLAVVALALWAERT
jgi:threonine/homoserine/homoserine lactone efflux protein